MKTLQKIIVACLLLLIAVTTLHAGGITIHKRIAPGLNGCYPVSAVAPCNTDTVAIVPSSYNYRDYNVDDIITLGIDHNNLRYYPDSMTCQVALILYPFDKNGVGKAPIHETLSVRYTPFTYTTYRDKAAFVFKNAYKVIVQIQSIITNTAGVITDTLPDNVYLDADIQLQRYYDYTTIGLTPTTVYAPDSIVTDCGAKADVINVAWNTQVGAEQYDLEWTFVNDYDSNSAASGSYLSPTQLSYNFHYNSTRITTTATNYNITLAYEHGYLIYRVRGVGNDMYNPAINVTGAWSLADSGGLGSASPAIFHVVAAHEGDSKDWQYNATFAEEGKKKEVITYYDGSLRSREAVTKMNSDSNVLVGQTIYDFQGRPAVTVLPTPVKFPTCGKGVQPSIHYYPAFNRVDSSGDTIPYTRYQYDLDKGDSCSVGADSMSILFGASNYYSPKNPRQFGFQAYVPDAHGYPFSQVQYTPDNTGRIKAQGGVGPQFQLGSGHETKYIYGQPNQIEMDRMFGSEMGDVTHYKKNVVIDPNGVASVSYLDQEGRTVATCLAGDPGKDSTGNFSLAPLPSQLNALQNLRVDLFAADANGHSNNNTVSIDGNSIVFNTQVTVGYTSTYRFSYYLKVDTLNIPCSKICYNCIYDLQVKVTDDCGRVVTSYNGENPVDTVLGNYVIAKDTATNGHFHVAGIDTVEFMPTCSSNHMYIDTMGVSMVLTPGNYTVSKILTVDSAALNYYVKEYLDSANRAGCVKTLSSFTSQAIANADTCNCHITCQTCAASLGDRDAFVAAGKGTSEEYDFLYQQCLQPCKPVTVCDAQYQQMLQDVSPDGQYGQYLTTTGAINPTIYPLSVYNENNRLPQNIANGMGNWQYPMVLLNGNEYPYYISSDGQRSTIALTKTASGGFVPAIINSTDTIKWVIHNWSTGQYYTYPENLLNFNDFRQYWQPTWAKSLVQYHPEYPYYTICQQYEQVQSPDTMSSATFDQRMANCNTFKQAISAGFINSNYGNSTNPESRLTTFYSQNSQMYDPFLTDPVFETDDGSVAGPGGSIASQFINKLNYYIVENGTPYSMAEAAAITARCGGFGATPPDTSCVNFGMDFFQGPNHMGYDDSIKNKEWNNFKTYYLSEKQILQKQVQNHYALYTANAFNACIGNTNYSNVAYQMWTGSFPWQVFNPLQTCSCFSEVYYANKQQRFVDGTNVPNQTLASSQYQYYQQTGQCPASADVMAFLNELAANQQLAGTQDTLQSYLAFPPLYNDIAGAYPSFGTVYQWNASVSGNTITATITNNTNSAQCTFVLNDANTGIASWNSISSFENITYTGTGTNGDGFTITAVIATGNDSIPYLYKTITGSSCITMHNCQLTTQWTPTQLAIDVNTLMTALAINGKLTGTDVNLEDAIFQPFLTPSIVNSIGPPNQNLRWSFVNNNEFELYDSANPNNAIITSITQYSPSSFTSANLGSIIGFDSLNVTGQNTFTLNGTNSNGGTIVAIGFSTSIQIASKIANSQPANMGTNGLPTPGDCQGPYYSNVTQLQALLNSIFRSNNGNGNYTGDFNIVKDPNYTPQLESYFPAFLDSTTSREIETHVTTKGNYYYDSLKFTFYVAGIQGGTAYPDSTSCPFYLWHKDSVRDSLPPARSFESLVSISNLTTTGNYGDGVYQSFYFIGTYLVPGGAAARFAHDTVWGYSCIPLLNCNSCVTSNQTPVTYTPPVAQNISIANYWSQYSTPPPLGSNNKIPVTTNYTYVDSVNVAGTGIIHIFPVTTVYYPFTATSSEMEIELVKPISVIDTPYANRLTSITIDSLSSDSSYYTMASSTNVSNLGDTLAAMVLGGLDSGRTYYAVVPRSTCTSCPAHSISYFVLRTIDETPFEGNTAVITTNSNNTALGPNLVYDGDFETVPGFAANPTDCYNIASLVYPQNYPNINIVNYPTTSPNMRFDSCNFEGYHGDRTDIYLIGGGANLTIQPFGTSIDTLSLWKHNPRSGDHFMMCDAPSSACTSCVTHSLPFASPPTRPVTYDYQSIAWTQTVQTTPGTVYNFSVWVEAIHAAASLDEAKAPNPAAPRNNHIPPAEFGVEINDSVYARAQISVDSGFGNWKQISFYWTATTTSATIQLGAKGHDNQYGSDYGIDDIYFGAVLPKPCSTPIDSADTVNAPIVTLGSSPNPCVMQAIDNADLNALTAYNEYRDSLSTVIRSLYMKHCLQPVESLHSAYQDKQYHYTLYYYDQGGNLVRTVPPQGVQLLPVAKSTDPLEVQIIHDRTFNQHTVFTNHVLGSDYVYNSLNQLTAQSVPDDDNMQIWNYNLPVGLNSGLVVTDVQFIDAANGYLSGYVMGPQGQRRGYLYKTHDAGHTWQPMAGTIAVNLNKAVMTGAQNGYAVGDNGIVMMTQDGGNSWDIVPQYQNGISQQLNAIAYDKNNTVAIAGNGVAFSLNVSSAGAPTYNAPVTGISATDSITGLTWDSLHSRFYAVGDSSGYGVIYKGTESGSAISWTKLANNLSSLPISKVQFLHSNPSHGYAAGLCGTLLHTTDKGQHWYMVPPSTTKNIRDIYFVNDNVGIALIDSAQLHCKLYTTGDGGQTWTLLSKPGESYYAMSFYKDSAGLGHTYKGVAVGYKGLIKRLVSNIGLVSPYFGEIPINTPKTSYNLRAVFAQATAKGVINIVAAGDGHYMYYTFNAGGSTANWDSAKVYTTSNKAAFVLSGSSNYMLPAIISDRGTLIRLNTTAGTTTPPVLAFADSSSATGNVSNFTAFAEAGQADGNDSLYAININSTGVLGSSVLSAPNSPIGNGSELYSTPITVTPATTITSIAYAGNGKLLAVDSNSQNIYTGALTGVGPFTLTWTKVSSNIHANNLHDITNTPNAGNTLVYSGGDRGRLYYSNVTTAGTVNFTPVAIPTLKKINGLVVSKNTKVLVAGDSSLLYRVVYSGTGYTSAPTALSVPIANTSLYGVTLNGLAAYVAGAKGTELYIQNYSTATVAQQGVVGGVYDFKAVCPTSVGGAILMGNASNVYMYGNRSGMQILSLYDDRFWAVHFMDVNHGYVVGDSGIIRRTDNGGALWQTVLPEILTVGGVPDYKTVWTTSPGNAILGGTGNFFGQCYSNNTTKSAGSYSYTGASNSVWYKVRFNENFLNSGYIVGSTGQILTLDINKGALNSFSDLPLAATPPAAVTSADLRSMHVFKDNSLMVVGSNGLAYYYYPYATTPANYWANESPAPQTNFTNYTWTDVYFKDDRTGYLVGNKLNGSGQPIAGEIMKAISPVNIQPVGNTAPIAFSWSPAPVDDSITANNIVSSHAQISYSSIAFTGPYDGFVGGAYSSSPPSSTGGYPYARLLSDKGGVFSSMFWYDRDGRLIISQNTKQRISKILLYSYDLYDALGRVIETGQKNENTDTITFNRIFGDTVMGFYNPNVININKYLTWIKDNNGIRTEVSHSYYDSQIILPTTILVQQELRNRIATITVSDTLTKDSTKYNNAIHYSYDVHGDVETIIQDDSIADLSGQRYKRIDYQHDLVSGNVNEADYQSGQIDQYRENYSWDADDRMTMVSTSKDSIMWDCDAKYFYYPYGHNALARMELGDQQVQGVDFANTLPGWIKGVNSDLLDSNRDMGHDGLQVLGNLNRYFARDAFGYTLKYFKGEISQGNYGDYDAINKSVWNNSLNRFEAYDYNSDLMNARHDLFNGNISAIVTNIQQPQAYSQSSIIQQPITLPQGTAYNYDQLERLIDMKAFQNIDVNNLWGVGTTYAGLYHNWLTYDANGNILSQKRADQKGNVFDSLTYHYNKVGNRTLQNRLYHVNDAILGSIDGITDDIRDEGVFDTVEGVMNQNNNYEYNSLGQLAKDKVNEIDTVIWTLHNKVKSIVRTSGSSYNNIKYDYNGNDDRIAKHVYTSSGVWLYSEYYTLDSKRSIFAIYKEKTIGSRMSYSLTERDIYGANRIGTENTSIELIGSVPYSQIDTVNRYLGMKSYELKNHLDNVLVTISDRKIPRPNSMNSLIDHYEADVISSNDYYGFGMEEPGRIFDSHKYRYGFNGKLKDNDIYGKSDAYDYEARFYDPRLGRFLSSDPLYKKFPDLSVYNFASNRPIQGSDLNGLEYNPMFTTAAVVLTTAIVSTVNDISNTWSNSVRFSFGEASIKLGISGGSVDAIFGKGSAVDAAGTTFFDYKAVGFQFPHPSTESGKDGSTLIASEGSISANFAIDVGSKTFDESISKAPAHVISGAFLGKLSLAHGEDYYGFGVGLGFGGSASALSVSYTSSYSLASEDLDYIKAFKSIEGLNNSGVTYTDIPHIDKDTKETTYTLGLVTDAGKIVETGIKIIKVTGDGDNFQSKKYKAKADVIKKNENVDNK